MGVWEATEGWPDDGHSLRRGDVCRVTVMGMGIDIMWIGGFFRWAYMVVLLGSVLSISIGILNLGQSCHFLFGVGIVNYINLEY